MLICPNCGSINNSDERFCRRCGAILPITSKAPRMRMTFDNDNSDELSSIPEPEPAQPQSAPAPKPAAPPSLNPQAAFFAPRRQEEKKDLQEIPSSTLQSIPQPSSQPANSNHRDLSAIPSSSGPEPIMEKSRYLEEITPKPFQGSLIASRGVYGRPAPKQAPTTPTELKSIQPAPSQPANHSTPIARPAPKSLPGQAPQASPVPSSVSSKNASTSATPSSAQASASPTQPERVPSQEMVVKRKRLEDDMSEVLGILSQKLSIPEKKTVKPSNNKVNGAKVEDKIPPSSMNDILKELLTIDRHIEASAIIKMDGTILASAISSRISDSLFATIGQNLSMIGNDIIEGLSAGVLRSISVRGSEGILDLAPIDRESALVKEMMLIIFSHPRVKRGIINIASNLIKIQIKKYLGL